MPSFIRMLCWSLSGLCVASCSVGKPSAETACPSVGYRIGEQPIRGIIYANIATKARVKACPGAELPLAFIGSEPADYRRLKQLAESKGGVVGFNALGDGYIVADGPGQYVLLVMTSSRFREVRV
jgi:hypothetical protein